MKKTILAAVLAFTVAAAHADQAIRQVDVVATRGTGLEGGYVTLTDITCPSAKLAKAVTFGGANPTYLAVSRAWMGDGKDHGEIIGCYEFATSGPLSAGPCVEIRWKGFESDADVDFIGDSDLVYSPMGRKLAAADRAREAALK